jgi:hypothetical protein
MSDRTEGFVVRQEYNLNSPTTKKIAETIVLPPFYDPMANLLKIELTMGQVFIESTHYERDD